MRSNARTKLHAAGGTGLTPRAPPKQSPSVKRAFAPIEPVRATNRC